MQRFINVLFAAALAVTAYVNLKQHNEIVQSFGETYDVSYQTSWGFYFVDRRLQLLEEVSTQLLEERMYYQPYPGGSGDSGGLFQPYPPGVTIEY